ncbi:MAG: S8 family serine peptidase [Prolixibacteraceae bacterium]
MKKYLIFLCLLYSVVLNGKEAVGNIYWVQFNTKINTPYLLSEPEYFLSHRALARRERQNIAIDSTDLPVNPAFIDSLSTLGFYVKHTSKWMNGAIVELDATISIDSILKPSFVDNYELRKGVSLKSASSKFSNIDSLQQVYYGNSLSQLSMIKGEILHEVATGKGVHIAIIDAGFQNSNELEVFDSLYKRGGVLGTYDFVLPGNDVYKEFYHGNAVFSIMAGNHPGQLIGSAPDASYWLLRTEDTASESPVEEDYWIIAAEFADQQGCDVINTSLGYSTFDNPEFNHNYEQFDGKTLRISKAANLAVQKGMVVVCSAGNSGNDAWGHIVAPSEARDVLSIAAVDVNEKITTFSSRGFSEDWSILKPDVAAMGAGVTYTSSMGEFVTGNGTSFSSPIIAGMAACLIEYYPNKTSFEITEMIRSLGNYYPQHNIEYGFGIPDFSKALSTETLDTLNINTSKKSLSSHYSSTIYPNPFQTSFTINNSEDYTKFELLNTSGERVFSTELNQSSVEISSSIVSNLQKGVYFAVFRGEHKVHSFKLMKY